MDDPYESLTAPAWCYQGTARRSLRRQLRGLLAAARVEYATFGQLYRAAGGPVQDQVALYAQFFDQLREAAATGTDAIELIQRVAAELRGRP